MWIGLTLCCIPLSHWYWRPFICASHADFRWSQSRRAFAKATGAVGEEVKFSTKLDSVASCMDLLQIQYCTDNSLKLSAFWKTFYIYREPAREKTQLDRRSSLKITADSNQSSVPAQKTKKPQASIQCVFFHCSVPYMSNTVITEHDKVQWQV